MSYVSPLDKELRPLSAGQIPAELFVKLRAENLARWPTGAEVDLEEAVDYHLSLPDHKRLPWVMRQAEAEVHRQGVFATGIATAHAAQVAQGGAHGHVLERSLDEQADVGHIGVGGVRVDARVDRLQVEPQGQAIFPEALR